MREKLCWVAVILMVLVLAAIALGYGYFEWVRMDEIDGLVAEGRQLSPGESADVEALVKLIEAEEVSLETKNRAIWALGQLGDSGVVDRLREMDVYEGCDHSKRICVRELRKAIQRLSR